MFLAFFLEILLFYLFFIDPSYYSFTYTYNVHDTVAGRDRTGVLAGLLESLAGYDAVTIRTDFLLSRIGYEPAREQLLRFALEGTGITAKSDLLAASSSSSSSSSELTDLFDSVPGFWNLTSLKPVYWDAFVQAVNDKFVGGFAGYVTSVLGFGEEDLATIRRNLAQAP